MNTTALIDKKLYPPQEWSRAPPINTRGDLLIESGDRCMKRRRKIRVMWRVDRIMYTGESYRDVVENIMVQNAPYMNSASEPDVHDFMELIADRIDEYKMVDEIPREVNSEVPEEFLRDLADCRTINMFDFIRQNQPGT